MKKISFVFLLGVFFCGLSAFSQDINSADGLHIPGDWANWSNPPFNPALIPGKFACPLDVYQTTFLYSGAGGFTTPAPTPSPGANAVQFKFTSGGGNPWANQWSVSGSAPALVSVNTIQTYFYTTGNAVNNQITLNEGMHYVVNWADNGYTDTEAIFMETSANPVSINSQTATGVCDDTQICATLSAAASAEERFYVRYTTNGFATSTLVEMSGTGTEVCGVIPNINGGTNETVNYYVFSSTLSDTDIGTNYDLATINCLTNGGANYSYTEAPSFSNIVPTPTCAGANYGLDVCFDYTNTGANNQVNIDVDGTSYGPFAYPAASGGCVTITGYSAAADGTAGINVTVSDVPGAAGPSTCDPVFISEYIEGSSNNKCIELYNTTTAAINLSTAGYTLGRYSNGSTTGTVISLTGTIQPGDVYVICNSSADANHLANADQTSGSINYNGDDAVALQLNGVNVDVIGQIGTDPGSQWGSGLTSTADNTIQRMGSITNGDSNGADAFDPSIEWNGFANGTFSGLGAHTFTGNCSPVVGPVCELSTTFDEPTTPMATITPTDPDCAVSTTQGSVSISGPDVSPYCETVVTHFGGNASSAINLTVEDIGGGVFEVRASSATGFPIDFLLVNGVSSTTVVNGEIILTLTPAAGANFSFNVLWSQTDFGGNWQLSQGNVSIPFGATCGGEDITNYEYAIVSGSTFTGTPAFTGIAANPTDLTSGMGTTAGTYTIRVQEAGSACYTDYTYTITAPNCPCTISNVTATPTCTGEDYSLEVCFDYLEPGTSNQVNIEVDGTTYGPFAYPAASGGCVTVTGYADTSDGTVGVGVTVTDVDDTSCEGSSTFTEPISPMATITPTDPDCAVSATQGSVSISGPEVSSYCETVVTHFGGNASSAINLTVANIGGGVFEVRASSATGSPIDFLLVNGVSSTTVVNGEIVLMLTPAAGATFSFNVLWSQADFGGNWQLSQGNVSIPFEAVCVGDITNYEYAIVSGSTFTGTPTFTAIAANPTDLTSGMGTTVGTYTIRIQEAGGACYTDYTYTIADPNCPCTISNIVPMTACAGANYGLDVCFDYTNIGANDQVSIEVDGTTYGPFAYPAASGGCVTVTGYSAVGDGTTGVNVTVSNVPGASTVVPTAADDVFVSYINDGALGGGGLDECLGEIVTIHNFATDGSGNCVAIDISGFTLTDNNNLIHTFPAGTTIAAGSTLMINTDQMDINPNGCSAGGGSQFANGGDNADLADASGNLIDSVAGDNGSAGVELESAALIAAGGAGSANCTTPMSCQAMTIFDEDTCCQPYTVTAAGVDPTTCGGSDGSITISGLTAGTNYTINYTGTAGTPASGATAVATAAGEIVITGLAAGSYTNLSVTDANTCVSDVIASVSLVEPSDPAAPIANGATYCDGDMINPVTATGIAGASFNWYTNATLTTAATGTSGTNNEIWTPTGTVGTETVYVTQTVANCEGVATAVAIIINADVSIVVSANDPTGCGTTDGSFVVSNLIAGNSYTLSYTGATGTPASNSIVTAGTLGNITVSGLMAGSYTNITIVDGNTCTSDGLANAVLVAPTAPAAPTATGATYCENEAITVVTATSTTSGTFNWYADAALTTPLNNVSGSNNSIWTPTGTVGAETVFVTVSTTGCESPASAVTVTVLEQPDAPIATGAVYCDTDPVNPVTATGTPGAIFNWYTNAGLTTAATGTSGANNEIWTPTGTVGTETVFVTQTLANCESEAVVVEVTVNPIPSAPTASGATYCTISEIDFVSVSGMAGASFNWYTDATLTSPASGLIGVNNQVWTPANIFGTQTVYVTQTVLNCEGAATPVTITVQGFPTIAGTANSPTTCGGMDGYIDLTFENVPDGDYTLNYTGGSEMITVSGGMASITGLTAGSYENFSLTVGNCTSIQDISFIISDPIVAPPSAIGGISCVGTTPNDVIASGATGAIFNWYTAPDLLTPLTTNVSGTANEIWTPSSLLGVEIVYVTQTVNNCQSAPTEVISELLICSGEEFEATNNFMATDPCACNNDQVLNISGDGDGTFSEVVTVEGPMGISIRIQDANQSGILATTFPAPLMETAVGSGVYEITFDHADGEGYQIDEFEFSTDGGLTWQVVTDIAGEVISIGNKCIYPQVVAPISVDFCVDGVPANLDATTLGLSEVNNNPGNYTFDLGAGAVATFDPSIGVGAYPLSVTYTGTDDGFGGVSPDSGVTAVYPGCIATTTMLLNVDECPADNYEMGRVCAGNDLYVSDADSELVLPTIGNAVYTWYLLNSAGVWEAVATVNGLPYYAPTTPGTYSVSMDLSSGCACLTVGEISMTVDGIVDCNNCGN